MSTIIDTAVATIVTLISDASDAEAKASRTSTEACRVALSAYIGTFGTELAAAPGDPQGARKVVDKILNGVKAGLIAAAPASAREEWDGLTWREAKDLYGSRDVHAFDSPYTAVLYSRLSTWAAYMSHLRRIVKDMHHESEAVRTTARELVSAWVEGDTLATFNGLLTSVKDLTTERRGPKPPKGPKGNEGNEGADANPEPDPNVQAERDRRAESDSDRAARAGAAIDLPEPDPIESMEDLRSAIDAIVARCSTVVLVAAVAAFVPTKTARRRFAAFLDIDPEDVENATD